VGYDEFPDISLSIKHQIDNFHTLWKEYYKILLEASKCLDYDKPVSKDFSFKVNCYESDQDIKGVLYYANNEIYEGKNQEIFLCQEAFL